jgi:two-component system, OmpR family, response regulator RegX3
MNILIVGDDPRSLELLTVVMRQENWIPLVSLNLHDLVAHHDKTPGHLVLLETTGPLPEAVNLCQTIKQRLSVPLVVLMPWTDEASQLRLYDAGADDCVLRPFSPRILQAKLRSLLWLSGSAPQATLAVLESGAVCLDSEKHTVTLRGGEAVRLTPLEFRLLYALFSNSGRVLPADLLIHKIWGYTGEGNRDLLKGLVRRLRSKLEPEVHGPRYIRTIPGVGYSFAPAQETSELSLSL